MPAPCRCLPATHGVHALVTSDLSLHLPCNCHLRPCMHAAVLRKVLPPTSRRPPPAAGPAERAAACAAHPRHRLRRRRRTGSSSGRSRRSRREPWLAAGGACRADAHPAYGSGPVWWSHVAAPQAPSGFRQRTRRACGDAYQAARNPMAAGRGILWRRGGTSWGAAAGKSKRTAARSARPRVQLPPADWQLGRRGPGDDHERHYRGVGPWRGDIWRLWMCGTSDSCRLSISCEKSAGQMARMDDLDWYQVASHVVTKLCWS